MVANLANSSYAGLAEQNIIVPLTYAGTLGFSLSTSSTAILPVSPQRRSVTFHNPGTQIIYVCQAADMNGNALTPGANAGNFSIYPGATWTFNGNGVAGAWLAAAAANTGNPFTVASNQDAP